MLSANLYDVSVNAEQLLFTSNYKTNYNLIIIKCPLAKLNCSLLNDHEKAKLVHP